MELMNFDAVDAHQKFDFGTKFQFGFLFIGQFHVNFCQDNENCQTVF